MSPVIEAVAVTKRHRRGSETVTAVDNATFSLWPGSVTALVGPSGSGKTTLLNLLVGGDKPDEGKILGLPRDPDWHTLAVVPQSLGLLDELTMGENVGFPIRLGAAPAFGVLELMSQLGVAALSLQSPTETSLGEQQRVAVARALITAPSILLADEPTSHQDEANAFGVLDALMQTARRGSCVVVATHDTRVLERCDRILSMSDGKVVVER